MKQTTAYKLPSFWASALINCDESGMSDKDIEQMELWLEKNSPGYCIGVSDDESEFVTYHDASQNILACDCFTFYFQK